MKKLLITLTFFSLIFASFPTPASAQVFKRWDDPSNNCLEQGVATLRCVPIIFQNVITAFLMFAGAVSLFLIIYAGIKLVTSGGDPKQVEAARKIMTYAIIGTVVVLSSFAIVYFIGYITGSSDCITDLNKMNSGGCQ